MSERASDRAVREVLGKAYAGFAAGDAEAYSALFAEDARALLLFHEALEGRSAVRDFWRSFFTRYDTSTWEDRIELVEIHGDHAYEYGTYTEYLRKREDGSRQLVRGRLIHFLRRDADGTWRISLLMNSHSHRAEPLT